MKRKWFLPILFYTLTFLIILIGIFIAFPPFSQLTRLSLSQPIEVQPALAQTDIPPLLTPVATWAEPPTPTIPPVPTLIPTPVVTVILTAQPPIIPVDGESKPYRLLYRKENSIYSIDNNGKNLRQLLNVETMANLFFPSYVEIWGAPSPDGTKLALVLTASKADASIQDIYLFDLNIGKLELLVQNGVNPVWSPDGTMLAYTRTGDLWIIDVAAHQEKEIYAIIEETDHFVSDISWAPNSKQLVFADQVFRQSSSIVVLKLDDLKNPNKLQIDDRQMAYTPQWSPDGSKILFISWAKSRLLADQGFYSLWTIMPNGEKLTQVTYETEVLGGTYPHWSPSGNWIAFTGVALYESMDAFWDLWITDATGNNVRRLTMNAKERVNVNSVAWSINENEIIYGLDSNSIWLVSLKTGERTQLELESTDFLVIP